MSLHLLGIRHHGPGSARSVLQALEELRPDVIALEAPADAEPALSWVAHPELKPPVALLIYPQNDPKRGIYYPLAIFSPEWQTLQWASRNGIPIVCIDLPLAHQFGKLEKTDEELDSKQEGELPEPEPTSDANPTEERVLPDPFALLAQAAGYEDHELWWEEQIERRLDSREIFRAVAEAMTALRQELPTFRTPGVARRDALREAYMRQALRKLRQGKRVAVVCGAWHIPALSEAALLNDVPGWTKSDDADRLKGPMKVKTTAVWIPWTYSRLAYRSGYGAGIASPGWYEHLWHSPQQAPLRWMTTAARLMRSSDLEASSASVIESLRLAEGLAALRDLSSPGLAELKDAILSVLCHSNPAPLRLIRDRLEIGDVLGETPAEAQHVPLLADLQRLQKSLRLKPSTEIKTLDLDLRKAMDRDRSHLLHRCRLLDIGWGELQQAGGRVSTFHEIWKLAWQPEFQVELIEASIWGNTIASAASRKALDFAQKSQDLSTLARLVDQLLLAGLSSAVDPVLGRLQNVAAVAGDLRQLMQALPALARVARYGDVRGTAADHVEPILNGLFERVLIGLLPACQSLDDEAAAGMAEAWQSVEEALSILGKDALRLDWVEQLRKVVRAPAHGLLRGRSCRLLLEKNQLSSEEFDCQTSVALSAAQEPLAAAHWLMGLLQGSGMVLLHQDQLWRIFDQWLGELSEERFVELLPLLRRAFADFSGPERRQMGEKVKHLVQPTPKTVSLKAGGTVVNRERARRVLPVLARILGTNLSGV